MKLPLPNGLARPINKTPSNFSWLSRNFLFCTLLIAISACLPLSSQTLTTGDVVGVVTDPGAYRLVAHQSRSEAWIQVRSRPHRRMHKGNFASRY